MGFRLMPREESFFDLLEKASENVNRASKLLIETLNNPADLDLNAKRMKAIEEDGDLWFVTGLGSGKVTEVLKDPHVCVTFQEGTRYLSLTGQAVVVCDAERLKQVWKERWRTWFPEGPRDPQVVLLQVTAEAGEFWDRGGLAGIKYLFRAGRAWLAGQEYVTPPDEHQKVSLQPPASGGFFMRPRSGPQ